MSSIGAGYGAGQDVGQPWGHDGVWATPSSTPRSMPKQAPADVPTQLPIDVSDEIAEMATHFGTPLRRSFHVQADEYIYGYRFKTRSDRRAEVVFAIEDAAGLVWVHAKSHYPSHIFRLPTGGVHWDEAVIDGLVREVKEETGLEVEITRFLGILDYHFWYGSLTASFVSYVFHLRAACVGCPAVPHGEPISEFRAVQPAQIGQLAKNLRRLPAGRRVWGEWRALAHDLVYDVLTQ